MGAAPSETETASAQLATQPAHQTTSGLDETESDDEGTRLSALNRAVSVWGQTTLLAQCWNEAGPDALNDVLERAANDALAGPPGALEANLAGARWERAGTLAQAITARLMAPQAAKRSARA